MNTAPLGQNAAFRAACLLMVGFVALAAAAPWIAYQEPSRQDPSRAFQAPAWDHWFGTDSLGRDIFSRLVFGARSALWICLCTVAIGLLFGVPLGLTAGFSGGPWDTLVRSASDILLSFPHFLVAIVAVALLGPSLHGAIIAVGISQIPIFTRVVRAQVVDVKHRDFVTAARALGLSDSRILTGHILPNVWTPLLVQTTLAFPRSMLAVASLGFLGLGAQPPMPEWGAEIAAARHDILLAPHAAFFPALAICLLAMTLTVLGDEVMDRLNPRV